MRGLFFCPDAAMGRGTHVPFRADALLQLIHDFVRRQRPILDDEVRRIAANIAKLSEPGPFSVRLVAERFC